MSPNSLLRALRSGATAAVAVVGAGAVSPIAAVLASGQTVVWRDTAKLFEPTRVLVVDAIRDFRLPMWNPHEALGLPLLGQQIHAVLHPMSVGFALAAPRASMDALIAAYVIAAAVGSYLVARNLGTSRPGAAVAGFGYGLSGYVLGMSSVVQYLGAAATAPWAIAALRAASAGAPGGRVAAAIAISCLVFAGEPQWGIVAVLIGALLAIDAAGWRGFRHVAVSSGLGVLVGAIQLIPAWAYFGESVRATGVSAQDRTVWALAPWRMLEFIAPGFFGGFPGGTEAPVYHALAGAGPYGIPFVTSASIGAVVLVLAAAGIRSSRAGKVLAGTAVASLWIAFGHRFGAEQLLQYVPVWGAFRYSEKLLGPFTLCVALLAALGTDRVAASARHGVVPTGVAAAACAGVALLLLSSGASPSLFNAPREIAMLAGERLGVGLLHAAAGLALLAVLRGLSARGTFERWFAPAVAVIVFAQGLAASPFALHAGRREARDSRWLEALRGTARNVRIGVPIASVESTSPTDRREFERLSAVEARLGAPSYNVASRIDAIVPYTGLDPASFTRVRREILQAFGPEQTWVAWRRFAMTHVSVAPANDAFSRGVVETAVGGGNRVQADPSSGTAVFAVPHRPYAFFAEGVVAVHSHEDAIRSLVDILERGSSSVVVEGPAPRMLAPGRVLSVQREAERVVIEAEAAGEALVVVNDAFWRGWKARIDGHPAALVRVDALVRGVAFPPGRHVLEMRYAPREKAIGAVVSVIGAVLVVIATAIALRRRVAARSL